MNIENDRILYAVHMPGFENQVYFDEEFYPQDVEGNEYSFAVADFDTNYLFDDPEFGLFLKAMQFVIEQ